MLKKQFLEYYKSERNCSELTIVSYKKDLEEFEAFYQSLNEDITWTTAGEDIIREWVINLLDEQKMSAASVNRKLSTLRSFYHYLVKLKKVSTNPMSRIVGPKKKKVLPTFVREQEMDNLIEILNQDKTYEGQLQKTIILTLYLTGIRRAELLSLQDKDIDFIQKQIKVTGKRDKQRIIPFGPELEETIKAYLEERTRQFEQGFEQLFISPKGKPITASHVEKIVKDNLTKVTTIKKRSPHVLRHTFATAMLNNNADLATIQKLLGHTNLNTTQVYTHVSFEELKNEYKNAHPRS